MLNEHFHYVECFFFVECPFKGEVIVVSGCGFITMRLLHLASLSQADRGVKNKGSLDTTRKTCKLQVVVGREVDTWYHA